MYIIFVFSICIKRKTNMYQKFSCKSASLYLFKLKMLTETQIDVRNSDGKSVLKTYHISDFRINKMNGKSNLHSP